MLKGKIEDNICLLDEWMTEKNTDINPVTTSVWSKKKAWWKCKKGHEWNTAVCTRASGSNCPFCANRLACNDNCLKTKHPDISKEWDSSKNGEITPEHVLPGTGKKYWWLCSKSHSYNTTPNNRTTNKHGCPVCKNKKITDENCLHTTHPDISKEWNIERNSKSPRNVTYGSSQKVWWICHKNHEWETTVASRARGGTGCPYCFGRIVTDNNRLTAKFPELCKEWNHTKNSKGPDQYTYGSDFMVWWLCDQNHEWESKINNRTINNRNCPYCCNRKISIDNSFGRIHPNLLKEWDWDENIDISPYDIAPRSNIRVGWECKNNHKWKTSISNRIYGTQCPLCKTHGYSKTSIEWLDNISQTERIFIQHKENLGEYRIRLNNGSKTKVDGYCKDMNTVYEYHGCFYHGHPPNLCNCNRFKPSELNPKTKKTYGELYKNTLKRQKQIIDSGYNLITIFGCEWKKIKKKSSMDIG